MKDQVLCIPIHVFIMQIIGMNILGESMKKVFILLVLIILLCGCSKMDEFDDFASLPKEYIPILNDYKMIVDFRLSDDFVEEYNNGVFPTVSEILANQIYDNDEDDLQRKWWNMIADMTDYFENPTEDTYGYVLVDVDGNNSPELVWLSSDGEIVFAIFTVYDGTVVLLDAYWSRYKAVILDSGLIYTLGSGSARDFDYSINELNDGDLHPIKQFGSRSGQYYEIIDGSVVEISEDKLNKYLYENPFEFGKKTWDS